jgi:hypothetical protein
MTEQIFDDDWFIGYRHRLLQISGYALDERRPHAIHNLLHGAGLGEGIDRRIEATLGKLPRQHAGAVRAHMQFYRACLTATGLLPADALVKAAVQIEWFWHTTAFNVFYRDHLAHVMKVAAIGLSLLEDEDGPLANGGEPAVAWVARDLASGARGSPAIRAAARRAGVSAAKLREEEFWRSAMTESVRLAGLLHDMSHPAVIASALSRIAASVQPASRFEPSEEETCRRAVVAFGHRLLASPWNRGELPDVKGLLPEDAQICAAVFRNSHSLRAGHAIVGFAAEAARIWQLSPFDAFVMEWAALAVSLHDYDKLFVRASVLEDDPLAAWLADPRNAASVRPCFDRDPVSYVVALADRLQEFGRVLGATGAPQGHPDADAGVRYPCRAVRLRAHGGDRDEATITVVVGPDDGTCSGATEQDYASITRHKKREEALLFGADGWLRSDGLFASVKLEVVRDAPRAPDAPRAAPRQPAPVKLFYSFAAEDEGHRSTLERHLATLKFSGLVADWHHRNVSAGEDWRAAVDEHLDAADVVLVLVSVDFLASDYLIGDELRRALSRHDQGRARVVPVLVRACDWGHSPLSKLAPLPANGRPVKEWPDPDSAWTDVSQGVRRVVEEICAARAERAR